MISVVSFLVVNDELGLNLDMSNCAMGRCSIRELFVFVCIILIRWFCWFNV